jgi:6-phosphogluconolactonase (cycloisomerase 2 family)
MTKSTSGRRRALFAAIATASTTIGLVAVAPLANASPVNHDGSRHAVFIQTNDASGNAVVSYSRDERSGRLTKFATYPTGGKGASQDGAVVDPLASQGSLTYDARHRLLFAVNAGSDTVTVFRVDGTRLERRQIVSSGGELPTSVSVVKDIVYVLDAANDGKITGFSINNDRLVPISHSTRSLGLSNPANPNFLQSPSQVAVTPDARAVVVATKSTGVLDVFTLDRHGAPSATPVVTQSAGAVPFALSFDRLGRLLVGEASGGESSYRVQRDGKLTNISAHVANGQSALCWSVLARGFVYVANAGSNTITGYAENSRGELTLLNANGVTATTDAGPVDLAATGDGRFLYQLATGAGAIDEFKVNSNGSLTRIGAITGLTPDNGSGYEGIAVS